ncbi:MAG TPA: M48 family metalloprotease [Thermoanaerobaculia bacterium]|jgi:Zn-dependent protease with chaperone function|nr:M48 family metalloprotease [Thermoanaerobaculia bacterium]
MVAEPLSDDLAYTPELRERILAGFRGDVPALRPSFGYRMALTAVAVAMVLLPLLYFGLIVLATWGVLLYSRYFFGSLIPNKGPWLVGALPLFTGLLVLVCLVKPLFARPANPDKPLKLDPKEEPLLFAFVGRLCQALGAPVPREIHVDCQVNASAGFRRGLLSLFGDDMVLTLGLPIVQGLSMQQLAGVMAHELGHFSQKAGMRVSYVIRVVNFWLVRLVYGRDRFDELIQQGADRMPLRWLRFFFQVALFCVKMTRWFLWALMMLGHMISSIMMKQMEYDADRYEVRLAGFSSFDSTMREMFSLGVAHQMAMDNLGNQWREKRLADNFPHLVLANRKEGVRKIAPQLEIFLRNQKPETFGTHPTAYQRTARAMREKGVGVFTSDLPATVLFYDFDKLSRKVSFTYYRELLGNQVDARNLISTKAVEERREQSGLERAAFERFFQNLDWLRGLPLPQKLPPLPEDPSVVISELEKARRAVLAKDEDHARETKSYREAANQRINALQAHALMQAGFRIKPSEFGLRDSDPTTALQDAESSLARMKTSAIHLEKFEKWEGRRLGLALVLLDAEQVRGRVTAVVAWRKEVPQLLACSAFLTGKLPRLYELRASCSVLEILVAQMKPDRERPRLVEVILEKLADLQERLKELHRELRNQPYLFDHGKEGTNLAQFAIPSMPAANDYNGLVGVSGQALERLHEVYDRILGRLAMMAEKVEEGLGMPPLSRSGKAGETAPAPAPQVAVAAAVPAPAPGVTIEPVEESKAEALQSKEAFSVYFRGIGELRTLPLPSMLEPLDDTRTAVRALREAHASAAAGAEAYIRQSRQYRDAEQSLDKAIQAESYLKLGLTLNPVSWGLDSADLGSAVDAQRQRRAQMIALEPDLQAYEAVQARRLASALLLLGDPRVVARVPEGDRRHREVPTLLASLAVLQQRFSLVRDLRATYVLLVGLNGAVSKRGEDSAFKDLLAEHMTRAHHHLQEIQRLLYRDLSPFAQGRGPVTLAQIAVPALPAPQNYENVFNGAFYAVRELYGLQRRILGRLAITAEKVEGTLELR